jgi:hypothetical protein
MDIASDLAAHRGVTLPGYIRSDSKPTDIGLNSEIERLAQIIPAPYTDQGIEPVIVKRQAAI